MGPRTLLTPRLLSLGQRRGCRRKERRGGKRIRYNYRYESQLQYEKSKSKLWRISLYYVYFNYKKHQSKNQNEELFSTTLQNTKVSQMIPYLHCSPLPFKILIEFVDDEITVFWAKKKKKKKKNHQKKKKKKKKKS